MFNFPPTSLYHVINNYHYACQQLFPHDVAPQARVESLWESLRGNKALAEQREKLRLVLLHHRETNKLPAPTVAFSRTYSTAYILDDGLTVDEWGASKVGDPRLRVVAALAETLPIPDAARYYERCRKQFGS